MLTFEYDGPPDEKLYIHGDVEGLRSLVAAIDRLLANTPEGKFDHDQLMTADWGGQELTSEPQVPDSRLIHHVKLYCCKGTDPA